MLSGIWVIGEIGHNQPSIKNLLRIVEYEEEPAVRLKISQAKRKIRLREKGIRILVVDENKEFLREFFQRLANDGFHILAAFDGNSGLEAVRTRNPDLILIDHTLRDMDGLKLLKKIKTALPRNGVPVIMTSNVNLKEFSENALAAGADIFLSKPFEYEEFIEEVTALV
jgi:DNA-binding response OmpR family regulator